MSNNMADILKNFEAASAGKKSSAGAASSNEMKKILESFQAVEECGMEEMPMQSPAGQPVTVNITASGKDNVADLISMMQQAAGIMQSGPAMVADEPQQDMDMAKMRAAIMPTEELEDEVEEWANSPEDTEGEPEYYDHQLMTKDLAGGLNREKKAYKKSQDGDNAMAVESIKDRLWSALNEKKETCNECGKQMLTAQEIKELDELEEGEQHGNSAIYDKCWKGCRKVAGKTRGEPGSCKCD